MTNYEKYKEIIELTFERGENIALNKETKEVVSCWKLTCDNCLFSDGYKAPYPCDLNRIKWLVSEYKEEVDWSKVPVDTPVLVSDNNRDWYHRHLAKVVESQPYIWGDGRTSWTTDGNDVLYKYIKLAEVE